MNYKVGARGHDIGVMKANDLAEKMRELSFSTVQLVPHKAIDGFPDNLDDLNSNYVTSIANAFKQNSVNIGLLGSYFNLLDQDAAELKKNIERFKTYLDFAKDFGATLVGTETGSFNSDWSYNIDNHTVESFNKVSTIIKDLALCAQKNSVNLGIEPVYNHTIYSPKITKKLIDFVDNDILKIIFDPVNLIYFGNYKDQKEIMSESFNLFGDKITLIHLKDFVIVDEEIVRVPLGRGIFDFEFLFSLLNKYNPNVELIIEELEGEELVESSDFLKKFIK